jgi:hypothetical protein
VCVVTCCFRSSVFILSVLRTPGKKKRTETQKQKRGKPKGGYLHVGVFRRTPRFLVFSLVFFLCPPYPCSTFALCYLHVGVLRVWHYNSTLHYCLIALTLELSAAYPELHIVLRRADFVSPGNRSSNLSSVLPVGCRSPLCAW